VRPSDYGRDSLVLLTLSLPYGHVLHARVGVRVLIHVLLLVLTAVLAFFAHPFAQPGDLGRLAWFWRGGGVLVLVS